MRSLRNVYKINTYMAAHICVSDCMIQLQKNWADFDEIWYVRYATGQ